MGKTPFYNSKKCTIQKLSRQWLLHQNVTRTDYVQWTAAELGFLHIPLTLNSINLFYIDFELKKLKISNGFLKNIPGNTWSKHKLVCRVVLYWLSVQNPEN